MMCLLPEVFGIPMVMGAVRRAPTQVWEMPLHVGRGADGKWTTDKGSMIGFLDHDIESAHQMSAKGQNPAIGDN
jgi:hypothetical protein